MWCFWSVKGGVGCSVVAASVALRLARTTPVLLVDLAGDLAALLGWDEPDQTLVDWLDAAAVPPDALARLELGIDDRLSLVTWNALEPDAAWGQHERFDAARGGLLAQLLARDERRVIVDLGRRPPPSNRADPALADRVLRLAGRSTLVTRSCFLGLRHIERWPRPDSIAMVTESGRSLSATDVQRAVEAPVVELRWDPAVARAVDAGLGQVRLPRSLGAVADQLSRSGRST